MCVYVCVHSEGFDVAVRLQRAENDVQEPEAEEHHAGDGLGSPGAPQLAADVGPAPVHENGHADQGEDREERDGERPEPTVHQWHQPGLQGLCLTTALQCQKAEEQEITDLLP